jgi:hypothetical protein
LTAFFSFLDNDGKTMSHFPRGGEDLERKEARASGRIENFYGIFVETGHHESVILPDTFDRNQVDKAEPSAIAGFSEFGFGDFNAEA